METLILAHAISTEFSYNPSSFTRTSFWIDFLRYLITGFIVSVGFAIWFVIVHRNAARRKEDPKDRTEPGKIPSPNARTYRKVWLVFILLVMLMFYSLIVVSLPNDHAVRTAPASVKSQYNNTLNVYVYGQQWMWQYYMPKYHLWYTYTTNLPANTVIQFHVTSRDVMHDFAIPAFKVKVDAFPGHWNHAWTVVNTPGNYMAECMEYCGIGHYLMRSPLTVMPLHNFTNWAQSNYGQHLNGAYGPYIQGAGINGHNPVAQGNQNGLSNQTAGLLHSKSSLNNQSNNTLGVLYKNLSKDSHNVIRRMMEDGKKLFDMKFSI